MKYSIIMPYYDRRYQLKKTLESFCIFYSYRQDYEVVLVEDGKNVNDDII